MRSSKKKPVLPRTLLLCIAACLILSGCSEKQEPEQIAREFLTACETAVQQRYGRALRSLVAHGYSDKAGRTARDIQSLVTGYLLRNRSIHIVSRIHSASFDESHNVQVSAISAFASLPINDLATLPSVNADIYWFEFTLSKENGNWLVREADWRPALIEDFMSVDAD